MKSKHISVLKEEYQELQSQLKEKERLLSQLKAILKEIVTDNDVFCNICLEKLQNPCILPDCLHRFCQDCLKSCIHLCSNKCPACRQRITNRREGLHQDKPFHRLLQKVYTMADLAEIVDPDGKKSSGEKDEKDCDKKIKVEEMQTAKKIKVEIKEEKIVTKKHAKVKTEKTVEKYQPPVRSYIGVARSRDKYKATITYSGKTYMLGNKYELASDAAEIFDRSVKILMMDHKTNFYNSLHWKKARADELIENLKKEVGEDNLVGIDLSQISKSVDPAFPTDDELREKFGLVNENSRKIENGVHQKKRRDRVNDQKERAATLTKKPRIKNQPPVEKKKGDQLENEFVVKVEASSHATISHQSKAKLRFKGVRQDCGSQKYQCRIWYNNKIISLGMFVLATDAAHVYDRARAIIGDADKGKKMVQRNFQSEKDYKDAKEIELKGNSNYHQKTLPSDDDIRRKLGIQVPIFIIVGTKVLKDFGQHGSFEGTVTSLPNSKSKYYHVTYTDGDGEDLFLSELEPLVAAYGAKALNRNKHEGPVSDLDENASRNQSSRSSISGRSQRRSCGDIDEISTPPCRNSKEVIPIPESVTISCTDMIDFNKAVERTSFKSSTDMGKPTNRSKSSENSEMECSIDSESSNNTMDACPVTPVKEMTPIPVLVTPSQEEMKYCGAEIICSAPNTTLIKKKSEEDTVIMTSNVEEVIDNLENDYKRGNACKLDERDIDDMSILEKTFSGDDLPERHIKLKRMLSDSNEIERCTKSLKSEHLSEMCSYRRTQSIRNEENLDSPKKKDVEDAIVETHHDREIQNKECLAEGCNVNTSLRKCTGCNIVKYCSRTCQEKDWYRHKEHCGGQIGNTSDTTCQPEDLKVDSCFEDSKLQQTRLLHKFLAFTASFRK